MSEQVLINNILNSHTCMFISIYYINFPENKSNQAGKNDKQNV